MRKYKLVLISKSTLKDADRKKLLDNVEASLGKIKAKVTELGQKPLAYPIKHEVSGNFAKIEFEADTIPADVEKRISANEDILRHLLIRE